jgi:hypothetical protein
MNTRRHFFQLMCSSAFLTAFAGCSVNSGGSPSSGSSSGTSSGDKSSTSPSGKEVCDLTVKATLIGTGEILILLAGLAINAAKKTNIIGGIVLTLVGSTLKVIADSTISSCNQLTTSISLTPAERSFIENSSAIPVKVVAYTDTPRKEVSPVELSNEPKLLVKDSQAQALQMELQMGKLIVLQQTSATVRKR